MLQMLKLASSRVVHSVLSQWRPGRLGWRLVTAAICGLVLWSHWLLADHLEFDHDPMMLRALLCVIVATVAGIAARQSLATRDGWLAAVVLSFCIGSGFYVGLDVVPDQGESSSSHSKERNSVLNEWSGFHYYLGNRYFAELGYDGLYEEALKADAQGGKRLRLVDEIRDMHTYERVAVSGIRETARREQWTDQRWEAFRSDLAHLTSLRSRGYWSGPLNDRGYNATPVWTTVAALFLRTVSLDSEWQLTVLLALDPLLLIAGVAACVWAYGVLRAGIVLAGIVLWYGSFDCLFGRLFQLDWLAAVLIGLAAIRRRRWAWGGVALGYATCVRVFPGALLFGIVVTGVWHLVRWRSMPRSVTRILTAAAASMVVLILVSTAANGRGAAAWAEFAETIQVHTSHHVYGNQRVGLDHLLTLDIADGLEGAYDDDHERRYSAANRGLGWTIKALAFVLMVATIRGRSAHDAALLAVPLVFFGVVASRYYGVIFALPLLMAAPTVGARAPPHDVDRQRLLTAYFIVIAIVHMALAVGERPAHAYLWGDALLGTYLVALLLTELRLGPRRPRVG